MIRAVLEGVAYSQKDCLDIIEGLGTQLESVRLSGGGARSKFWRQMFADVFSKRVVTLETQEGSAYGAALLALVGTGAYGSVKEACAATVREVDVTLPQREESEQYRRGHEVYQSLYPALAPIYRRIAAG
jgi:xylulokinase